MNANSEQNAAKFEQGRDDVFDRIAKRYDLLSDLFSVGIHRLWKRELAATIDSEPWTKLLDGASGTGDIVLRLLANANVQDKHIIVSDLSPAMLEQASNRLNSLGYNTSGLEYMILNAQNMIEIADESIDCFSFSLCAKICDRQAVFEEAMRVLVPGGRFLVLEASVIPNRILYWLYLRYMNLCMPIIGWIATGGDSSAYQYLLKGIEAFPGAEELSEELTDVGFDEVIFKRLTFGVVAIHIGKKIFNGARLTHDADELFAQSATINVSECITDPRDCNYVINTLMGCSNSGVFEKNIVLYNALKFNENC